MNQLKLLTRPSSTPLDLFGVSKASLYIPPLDLALDHLFRLLSPDSILDIMEHVIAERQIVFHCKNLTSLMLCIEGIIALMYPFEVRCPVNPCLPLSHFDTIFNSPTPFINGIHSCFRDRAIKILRANDVPCIIVDLNSFPDAPSSPISRLPLMKRTTSASFQPETADSDSEDWCSFPQVCRQLMKAQMHYFYTIPSSVRGMSASARTASLRVEFVKMWSHLLSGYRNFAIFLPRIPPPLPPLPLVSQKDEAEALKRLNEKIASLNSVTTDGTESPEAAKYRQQKNHFKSALSNSIVDEDSVLIFDIARFILSKPEQEKVNYCILCAENNNELKLQFIV